MPTVDAVERAIQRRLRRVNNQRSLFGGCDAPDAMHRRPCGKRLEVPRTGCRRCLAGERVLDGRLRRWPGRGIEECGRTGVDLRLGATVLEKSPGETCIKDITRPRPKPARCSPLDNEVPIVTGAME